MRQRVYQPDADELSLRLKNSDAKVINITKPIHDYRSK